MGFAGVFAPVPTPFDARGKLLLDRLQSNLERWSRSGLHGLVVLGSNGEAAMLTDREKVRVLRASREAIPRTVPMIAGTGMQSLAATLDLTRQAALAGAEAALVLTPHYYRSQMTGPALVRYYRELADGSSLPVLIYNMPGCTGVDIEASTVIQLSSHPNIAGIKDSSGVLAKLGAMVAGRMRPDFAVIAGSGGALYPALCLGAQGSVAALANVLPQACVQLYQLFQAGQHQQARELQLRLIPVNQAVTARWGVAGLKAALDELGYCYGGPPRPPLLPLEPDQLALLRQILAGVEG